MLKMSLLEQEAVTAIHSSVGIIMMKIGSHWIINNACHHITKQSHPAHNFPSIFGIS